MSVLKVRFGASVERNLARFGETLTKAKSGRSVTPYFGVGFRTMARAGAPRSSTASPRIFARAIPT